MRALRFAASIIACSLSAPLLARATSGPGHAPAFSADGRCVAFESAATDLVVEDTNGFADVFVYDLGTGAISRVSVATGGEQGNGDSFAPSISADGRYVAFRSFANNLDVGDTNGLPGVFVHDRSSGATCRVSEGTLRVLAAKQRDGLGETRSADPLRSLLRGHAWSWTDASEDDPDSLLLARCAEHAALLDGSDAPLPIFAPALPADFLLSFPLDHSSLFMASTVSLTLSWSASIAQDGYDVELADEPSFASLVYSANVDGNATSHAVPAGTLHDDHLYYWRVTAINASGTTVASNAPFQFTVFFAHNPSDPTSFNLNFCFVATAAYGSPMEPEVQTLRTFRDRVLVRTAPGRAFVDWYYRNSPPLAAAIAKRPAWRTTTRVLLWPVVGFAHVVLWSGEQPISASALAIVLLVFAWLGVRHVRRLRRSRASVARGLAMSTS